VDGAGSLKGPGGLAVDAAGNLYVADGHAHCIRKVTPDGKRSVFAGTEGQPGEPGAASEAADKAHFSQPRGLAMGADGTLYVADAGNQALRAVKDGKVTTLAALQCGATDPERLSDLGGLALSPDGKWLFVANGRHVVRFTVGAAASPTPSASPSPSPSPSADATASGTP
jgi:sugar lactone lactonase YvrE